VREQGVAWALRGGSVGYMEGAGGSSLEGSRAPGALVARIRGVPGPACNEGLKIERLYVAVTRRGGDLNAWQGHGEKGPRF